MNCHYCGIPQLRKRPRIILKSSCQSKLIKSPHCNLYSNHNALSIFPRKLKKKTTTTTEERKHTHRSTNTDRMDFQDLTDRKQNMWHTILRLPLQSPVSTLLTFHAASLSLTRLFTSISVFLMNWRIRDHSCTTSLPVLF